MLVRYEYFYYEKDQRGIEHLMTNVAEVEFFIKASLDDVSSSGAFDGEQESGSSSSPSRSSLDKGGQSPAMERLAPLRLAIDDITVTKDSFANPSWDFRVFWAEFSSLLEVERSGGMMGTAQNTRCFCRHTWKGRSCLQKRKRARRTLLSSACLTAIPQGRSHVAEGERGRPSASAKGLPV